MRQERNYSLVGESTERARQAGLVTASWYRTTIDRKTMKALMRREDSPATRDTIVLFTVMLLSLSLAVTLWPGAWSIPFWLIYGVLYGSAMDSRWHECGHGTAFKTPWKNNLLYQVASFMMIRNPVTWRWSHARHHTDTIIVGRDPEIVAMRPPNLLRMGLNFLGILDALDGWKRMLINAAGSLTVDEADYIPESEWPKVFRVARIWVVIYAATLISAFWLQSILPLLIIGLPRLYGAWHHVLTGILQHAGLADNVIDHRLNCRTVYMNPISRFIYWNMNYHIEHHMFPMVPYHRLPELHQLMINDSPEANTSMWRAYRDEVIPSLLKQRHDYEYWLRRPLPQGANPYLFEPETVKGGT